MTTDKEFIEKIKTLGVIVRKKERLPLGEGSRGRFVTPEETGGLGILIPSFGAMEKEEVDYVAGMAIEKEKERIKKKPESRQKERLGQVSLLMRQAKAG